jgi:hypothetical protein
LEELRRQESSCGNSWCLSLATADYGKRVARDYTGLSQAAVAKVIEEYLWDSGERSENTTGLARQLKDRVSRALNGEGLSTETLGWFIAAFDMDKGDENHLWAALGERKTILTEYRAHYGGSAK